MKKWKQVVGIEVMAIIVTQNIVHALKTLK